MTLLMSDPDLSGVLKAIPIPAFLVAPNARIEAVNEAAAALLGSEVEGRHYVTVLRQPAILEAIETAARDVRRVQGRFTLTDAASEKKFRVTAAPVGRSENVSVMVCLEDVTPTYEAGQMRRDFVANVSHELRTPLTALLGFIDTLQGPARDDPEARDRFLTVMSREARRMNRLVGDLLSLSRVEYSERQRPQEPVCVHDVLAATIMPNGGNGFGDGYRVRLTVEPGAETAEVMGDADQLRQVFNNLIENALKYGGEAEDVDVTLRLIENDPLLPGPAVCVDVRDKGEGIAPHHLPRLTERFYRVDEHRSRELGGTGLGLAIVKHITQRHRGRFEISSTVGEGSCFSVVLPR